jgi:hypothetical protein
MSVRKVYIQNPADLERQLQGPPAVFLSASIPYERPVPKGMKPDERRRFVETNKRYVDAARPVQVRSAVVALTRSLLMRGKRLVFGAHPAISPIVLSVAHDLQPEGTEPRIIIFQSQYFESELPASTLHLASWEAGLLVFTPVVQVKGKARDAWRGPSLALMRKLMVSVPNLQGAIFVGGMEGVMAEADAFRAANPGKPIIPLASTGSAATELWEKDSVHFAAAPGKAARAAIEPLQHNLSYSLVAEQILGQLGDE